MKRPPPDSAAPVAIVGAGPVGLSLALGLARHGVRSVVFEKKPRTSERSKAPVIHLRTREIFRQWRVEERFLRAGTLRRSLLLHDARASGSGFLSVDFSELEAEADEPGLLFLEQGETERLLLEAVRESTLSEVRFGAEVVGLGAAGGGTRLTVREDGRTTTFDAEYLAGCDGASSFTRGALGLPFEGSTYSVRPMLADVRVRDARDGLPWPRMNNAPGGLTFTFRLAPGLWRIIRLERGAPQWGEEVPDEEVQAYSEALLGPGQVEVLWANRFRIHKRAAPVFRVGRVLLAGDAAHVHSPAGGLGMNAGIQDAHNLAWKLAAALEEGDVERLLDSYDVERRAVVVEDVSAYADVLTRVVLQTPSTVRAAAFALLRAAYLLPPLRRASLRRATMIDLGYPGSPLLEPGVRAAGVRLPNPVLRTPGGEDVRLYDLIPSAPAMLDVADDRAFDRALPVEHVVAVGPGGHRDPSGSLRALLGGGDGWILVRPDAHVAWARRRREGLVEATRRSLGLLPGPVRR